MYMCWAADTPAGDSFWHVICFSLKGSNCTYLRRIYDCAFYFILHDLFNKMSFISLVLQPKSCSNSLDLHSISCYCTAVSLTCHVTDTCC